MPTSTSSRSQIKVCFFASLSEALGIKECLLDVTEGETLHDIKHRLIHQGEPWQVLADSRILCALNYEMITGNPLLHHQDEVAFFPPVTGG